MKLIKDAEDISNIAFGFMASKALFAALHLSIFDKLAGGAKTARDLAADSHATERALTTLLTSLSAIGLLDKDGEEFTNAPGAQAYLVSSAPSYFGDYLQFQIDRQMYPFMQNLTAVLEGKTADVQFEDYESWMSDPKEAELFSRAQHGGSLGPGKGMAKLAKLEDAKRLIDVGGGTGAFAIRFCERYPDLRATVLDFPNVIDVGKEFVAETAVADRIEFVPGNALKTPLPEGQDAVLMSYLFSGVAAEDVPSLIERAFGALNPGGKMLIHDFMVEDDRQGPPLAALWALQHLVFTPKAASLTPSWVGRRLRNAGFRMLDVGDMIPGMTKYLIAEKPV